MIGGLLLAVASAALINLGFLLQHRGLSDAPAAGAGLARQIRHALRNRCWLAGQALGWVGFVAQMIAVAFAPLSLVQAFAAGGLALSIPLAAGVFGHRISTAQTATVLVIAAALAVLPVGFATTRDHLSGGSLGLVVVVGATAAAGVARFRRPALRAIAAGGFYGLADAAIKAVSLGWPHHGLVSPWTAVAAAGTFAGFLAFQAALKGDAVPAISLMNGLATVTAAVCGVLAFGESLGTGAPVTVVHVLAIAAVLGGIPVLAAAQTAIVQPAEARQKRPADAERLVIAHRPQ